MFFLLFLFSLYQWNSCFFFLLRWGSSYSLGTRFSECLPGLFFSCSSFWISKHENTCMTCTVMFTMYGTCSYMQDRRKELKKHLNVPARTHAYFPAEVTICHSPRSLPWHWWCHKGQSSILRYKGSEPRCWGERGGGIWQGFSFALVEAFFQAHSLAEKRICEPTPHFSGCAMHILETLTMWI